MKFFKLVFKWLGYIFEFLHSPFTVIAKEVEGKVDYATEDHSEIKESRKDGNT